jgi:parvulin-like peptidyl-prolyl isomerase
MAQGLLPLLMIGAGWAPGAASPKPPAAKQAPAPAVKKESSPAGGKKASEKAGAKTPADYTWKEAALPPGEVARVLGRPITAAEVQQKLGMLKVSYASHGTEEKPEDRMEALRQALDEKAISHRLRSEGLSQDPRVKRMRTLYEILFRANAYERQVIRPKVTVSEAEVAARLPRSRDQVQVRVLLLKPEQEEEIRQAAAGTSFEKLVDSYSKTGSGFGQHGDLGFLEKNGTYFSAEDEDLIWNLKPGELSRVIETQIGPMIVRVGEKRQIAEEDWQNRVQRTREQLANDRYGTFVRAVIARHTVERDYDAFREIAKAMAAEDRITDAVVGSVDGVPVTFHDLDQLLETSYQDVVLQATASQIESFYIGFFASTADRIALGKEAEAFGLNLDERGQQNVERYTDRAILSAALQDAIRGVKVTDKEVRAFYEENRKRFEGADQVKLAVAVTDTLAEAQRVMVEYLAGTPFSILAARYSKDGKTRGRGGDTGWVAISALPNELAAGVATAQPGEFLPIFQNPEGYTATLLVDKGKQTALPLAKVQGTIRRHLLRQKRAAAVLEKYQHVRLGIEVELDRKQLDAVTVKRKAAAPVVSPHGAH